MKTLIALLFYAVVSGLLGLVVCGLLWWFKKKRAAAIMAAIFFGGPVVAYIHLYIRDTIEEKRFKEDVAYVQELCRKDGGVKIYKTVNDVEGIFQIKAGNPDVHSELQDQYGMDNPWAREIGDSANLEYMLSFEGKGYLYIEQQPGYGIPEGPPYRLLNLHPTGRRMSDIYPNYVEKDRPPTTRAKAGWTPLSCVPAYSMAAHRPSGTKTSPRTPGAPSACLNGTSAPATPSSCCRTACT